MAKDSDLISRSRLPDWVIRSLQAGGLQRLGDVAAMPDTQLLKLAGIGPRALGLIRAEIDRWGSSTPPPDAGKGKDHSHA